MDKLQMAIDLLTYAHKERERLNKMNAEIAKLSRDDKHYWTKRYEIERKYRRIPRKAGVNTALKEARNLILDEYIV